MTTRSEILRLADSLVSNDRRRVYGPAKSNHEDIAKGWNIILERRGELDAATVCLMMVWLKVCRAAKTPTHIDSYIDMCGYAAIAAEIVSEGDDESAN